MQLTGTHSNIISIDKSFVHKKPANKDHDQNTDRPDIFENVGYTSAMMDKVRLNREIDESRERLKKTHHAGINAYVQTINGFKAQESAAIYTLDQKL
jgi:hypothetical protein